MSAADTLLGLHGKGHVLHSCAVLMIREEHPSQDKESYHGVQEWLSYWASSLALNHLLCSLTACSLSGLSILDARVGDSCSGSGQSTLDLVHNSTTSFIKSAIYLEETKFTFLLNLVKYHALSWNNIAVLINTCKCAAVHLWDKMVHQAK